MLAYLGFDRQVFVLQPLLTNDNIWFLVALKQRVQNELEV
jgi:hypothetical protein